MNPFSTFKKHFEGKIDSLKIGLEWSLELSLNQCTPRDQYLVWLRNEVEELSNNEAFAVLIPLLEDVECPEDVISLQTKLSRYSNLMGLRLPTNGLKDGSCLYIDYKEGIRKYEGFKWKNDKNFTSIGYQFQLLSERLNVKEPISLLHEELKECGSNLLKIERLNNHSGYLCQNNSIGSIKEVYFAFPWLPKLGEVLSCFPKEWIKANEDKLRPYLNYHFKHLGLSSASQEDAFITIYFTANHKGSWPNNFKELQQSVNNSAIEDHNFYNLFSS